MAAVALVLSVALALPVIFDILSHLRKLTAALTYTVTDTKVYKVAKDTFVFRMFKRLIRVAVVIILLFTLGSDILRGRQHAQRGFIVFHRPRAAPRLPGLGLPPFLLREDVERAHQEPGGERGAQVSTFATVSAIHFKRLMVSWTAAMLRSEE